MTLELLEIMQAYAPSGRLYHGERVLFGIDSDGCVDTGMRKKHTDPAPFAIAGIDIFGLDAINAAFRIAWTYVNEFKDRGCPRFSALSQVVDYVLQMPEVQVQERLGNIRVPRFKHLKRYVETVLKEKGAGDDVLKEYVDSLDPQDLEGNREKEELGRVLRWSQDVNVKVNMVCPYIPPFKQSVETINQAYDGGIDIMIVSGTPEEHLKRQWEQHGLLDKVIGVYGRDTANKNVLLQAAVMSAHQRGIPYDRVIMFGDAPGDDRATKKANQALLKSGISTRIRFNPIRAGCEEQDWRSFRVNAMDNLRAFDEETEKLLIDTFYDNLNVQWNPNLDISKLFTR